MRFLLASNNAHKRKELDAILRSLCVEIVTPSQIGLSLEIEETGSSFEENALIKAQYAAEFTKISAIADDSGLCVAALQGLPGIFSARFAGENATDKDRIDKLLSMMAGVKDRWAEFVCVIAFCDTAGEAFTVRGVCRGQITDIPMGENGFGYDPVFFSDELHKTFAQLAPEEKNRVSHRGRAISQLYDRLQSYLTTKDEK